MIGDVAGLEAVVGAPRAAVLGKTIHALDDGSRRVLAASPAAWLGYRDGTGTPRTTLVGAVHAESPTRIRLELPPGAVGSVSFVFLLPGVRETLRLNGVVRAGDAVEVREVFVHCGRCVLRSKLWEPEPTPPGADFLAASPFVAISSWDADGNADTSPRGDEPGFVRVLDEHTLAVPDRRGNGRTDTFHNVLACDRVSLAALIPGRDELLHVDGTASITDDADLLRTMPVGRSVPHAALIVRVRHTEIRRNAVLPLLWRARSSTVDGVPDLMRLAVAHAASNQRGALRAVGRGLAGALSDGLVRRGMDAAYRRSLRDEGYSSE
ncbi:hypothetical protein Val02_36700 [Virgisporangium aliadipatigenens]|uniref:Pyridoxamine 5'-phosphate oxidase N-terminal domain-containing protein n=1 Tax=Virgisporangium aliadipatigenens TaxID=741659 RepID=A0A8J3YJX4_9ACTN|nr:pyridoxamine 5'-phosphate oxidase family protein [Virgisporangium aliadipatigenens]GIJ46784.1 hypothetical protein Val02_36700 [Virgisporangium aliadipatigenens]